MKKIFTLALLLVTVLTASAKSRTWDFTHWSAATLANLQKGMYANCGENLNPANGWSDVEKASGGNKTNGKCFWEVKHQGSTAGAQLCADGQPMTEFEGLLYTNTADRSLAIAVDYNNGNQGASYLWTGSKDKVYFVIPNVAPGAKITMGVESHKPTEARGYKLFVAKNTTYDKNARGTELKDVDGNAIAQPTTYEEQTWYQKDENIKRC